MNIVLVINVIYIMRNLVYALVLIGCVYSVILEEDDVWVLNEENFEEAFLKQAEILVEFYAPWCGHCKKLAPEYSKAAKKLKDRNPSIHIAKIDATVNKNLSEKFEIQGFPTLKYFIGNKPVDYQGGKTEDSIVSWVLKKTGNTLQTVLELPTLISKLSKTKVATVLFAELQSKESTLFSIVAKTVDDCLFFICPDSSALPHYKISSGSVVLFKQYDEKRVDYSGVFSSSEIIKFVEKHKRPLIVKYNENLDETIFGQNKPCLLVLRHESEEKLYEKILKKLSRQLEGKILIAYSDLSTEENRKLLGNFGLSGKKQPSALILDPSNNSRFFLDAPIDEESLKKFLKDWKAGKSTPLLKSQEIPAKDFENFVRVLVGKNFEELVFDPNKDVLVEFYAPWCKHCKDLAPKYEQLAKNYRNVKSLVIAKIDATANEVKGIKIEGYPTILYFTGNNKKGIQYSGPHDLEALKSFVESKSTHKFTKQDL